MEDTHRRLELTLDAIDERLDRALTAAVPELSRMQWQRLIREGLVTVDGERARPSYRVQGGETLVALVPAVVEAAVQAEDIPLDVRYEDSDLIVVNK
ncbi:MAG TPA: S4 domain-containing protein, partial [Promineifilum sp.]|nr:S4 domain-containing protein [Promineifilum sp.]